MQFLERPRKRVTVARENVMKAQEEKVSMEEEAAEGERQLKHLRAEERQEPPNVQHSRRSGEIHCLISDHTVGIRACAANSRNEVSTRTRKER